jgi:4-aminobutyrate aminotransferase/(S)-3-amino-2-methylpropionate transaminase
VKSFFDELKKECAAIGDVRGLGAMVAFELVKNGDPHQPNGDLCKQLMQACAKKGLLIISAGTSSNIVRVLSPLIISKNDLQKGLQIIRAELLKLTSTSPEVKTRKKLTKKA